MNQDEADRLVRKASLAGQRLKEKQDPGRALKDALAVYDEHFPAPCGMCGEAHKTTEHDLYHPPQYDPNAIFRHASHVHCSFHAEPTKPHRAYAAKIAAAVSAVLVAGVAAWIVARAILRLLETKE